MIRHHGRVGRCGWHPELAWLRTAAAAASLGAAVIVDVVSSATPAVAAAASPGSVSAQPSASSQRSSSFSVQPLRGSPWQQKPLDGSLRRRSEQRIQHMCTVLVSGSHSLRLDVQRARTHTHTSWSRSSCAIGGCPCPGYAAEAPPTISGGRGGYCGLILRG